MKLDLLANVLVAALLCVVTTANAQWPGAQDYGSDDLNTQSGSDGSQFYAPILSVPFGASTRPTVPFGPPTRPAPLFPTVGYVPYNKNGMTPSEYNLCKQYQSADPVRAINCSQ
jgi:hypothetical protein